MDSNYAIALSYLIVGIAFVGYSMTKRGSVSDTALILGTIWCVAAGIIATLSN